MEDLDRITVNPNICLGQPTIRGTRITMRVSQILPATASDEEILAPTRRDNKVIITQDLDFSTLLALHGYNRPSLTSPKKWAASLTERLPSGKSEIILTFLLFLARKPCNYLRQVNILWLKLKNIYRKISAYETF